MHLFVRNLQIRTQTVRSKTGLYFKVFFFLIKLSCCILYATKSSIETNFKSNFFATSTNSGKRAIVPSSFIISQMTPAENTLPNGQNQWLLLCVLFFVTPHLDGQLKEKYVLVVPIRKVWYLDALRLQ